MEPFKRDYRPDFELIDNLATHSEDRARPVSDQFSYLNTKPAVRGTWCACL